jgi:site-specific recombinase XerD
MLLQGLRSAEVLALNRDDVLLSEAQLRVRGKGNKLRFLPLAPETIQLLDHYLRLERPQPCTAALFVLLKAPAVHVPLGKLKTERMVPMDSFVCEVVQRLAFFRSLDPLPADGRLLVRPHTKDAIVRQLRDYLHQVCHALGLSTRIVPHQLRHTYATEMLRAGVGFPVLMKLLGHTSPEMTMRYLDVALTDLQREFQRARSQPRHLVPQPKMPSARLRAGLDGVIDSLLAAQPCAGDVPPRAAKWQFSRLPRPAFQPAHQDSEARKLPTP